MIPRSAGRRAFGLLASLVLVLTIAAPAAAVDGDRYVALANAKRDSVGLGPVSLSAAVDKVSDERAVQMASNDDFSHDMEYVAQRLKALGVCFTRHGEIIAWERGYPSYDPARTMESWWNSTGHHSIIVGDYNAAGGSHRTSSASGKTYSVMVFVKLCSTSSGGGETQIKRLSGSDRYATAAAISKARFAGGASTVFVATGASFPDALSGSAAAAKFNGPILLTDQRFLSNATRTELDRLNPSRIIILGGTSAVSSNVATQLAAYAGTVERWSGADRFATAAVVSKKTFGSGVPVAYIATGMTFPDALSGGSIAGKNGAPILLVKQYSLPGVTASELARLKPGKIVILGGTGAVGENVAQALKSYASSVSRLAGADRYATSVMVSKAAYGSGGSEAAFVATGSNFPDGLAGGPVAALVPGPLLLVATGSLPSSVRSELQRLSPAEVLVLGGSGSVSGTVVTQIDAALP